MIETLELNNFKSHRDTKLVFDGSRLHAIVGKNSSGKTSILQSIYYFKKLIIPFRDRQLIRILTEELLHDFIFTTGKDDTYVSVNGIKIDNINKRWQISYCLGHRSIDKNVQWKIDDKHEIPGEGEGKTLEDVPHLIKDFFKSTDYIKLVASNLSKAGYSEKVIPTIEFNGSGLAPMLDYLRSEYPDRFQSLQELLQQIVPSVKKLEVKRAKVSVSRQKILKVDDQSIPYEESQEMVGQEVYLSMDSGDRIPARAISEGTMLTLGLLTVLMNPDRPNLVLLDDVEQGLHPKAQRELITVFKKILEMNPDLQIIFTTHSPYIIDELTPSQVHVLSTTKSGYTRAKRLDEHPDVEWAKQTLTTGEFWDAEGEDWVLEGESDG